MIHLNEQMKIHFKWVNKENKQRNIYFKRVIKNIVKKVNEDLFCTSERRSSWTSK